MRAPNERTPGKVGTDSRALMKADSAILDNDFERLKLRFDTRRITLDWLPSGELIVHQGQWCRVLPSLSAAHQFARLIGV
jgi:hypothetical protein